VQLVGVARVGTRLVPHARDRSASRAPRSPRRRRDACRVLRRSSSGASSRTHRAGRRGFTRDRRLRRVRRRAASCRGGSGRGPNAALEVHGFFQTSRTVWLTSDDPYLAVAGNVLQTGRRIRNRRRQGPRPASAAAAARASGSSGGAERQATRSRSSASGSRRPARPGRLHQDVARGLGWSIEHVRGNECWGPSDSISAFGRRCLQPKLNCRQKRLRSASAHALLIRLPNGACARAACRRTRRRTARYEGLLSASPSATALGEIADQPVGLPQGVPNSRRSVHLPRRVWRQG
jgi:hypothetical protein